MLKRNSKIVLKLTKPYYNVMCLQKEVGSGRKSLWLQDSGAVWGPRPERPPRGGDAPAPGPGPGKPPAPAASRPLRFHRCLGFSLRHEVRAVLLFPHSISRRNPQKMYPEKMPGKKCSES